MCTLKGTFTELRNQTWQHSVLPLAVLQKLCPGPSLGELLQDLHLLSPLFARTGSSNLLRSLPQLQTAPWNPEEHSQQMLSEEIILHSHVSFTHNSSLENTKQLLEEGAFLWLRAWQISQAVISSCYHCCGALNFIRRDGY